MAEKLTPQQEMAVSDRGGKLLVSAAAGSGKTKVLVDRLMSYLADPVNPANIDDFLIITYTKAAAAELRAKIGAKLSEKLLSDPDNRHLQRQMQRLYLTQISTVHAFCTELLREYAYRLDIAGDFRVAEENECIELESTVLERLLEDAYEHSYEDPDFCAFMDTQGFGRDDRQVPEIILQVYNSARCHLDPEGWLDWCLSVSDVSAISDASETVWGSYLIEDLHRYLDLHIDALTKCHELAKEAEGMEKPAMLLADTLTQLKNLRECTLWDDIIDRMHIDYGRLTFSKKCTDTDLIGKIKAVRDACKKGVTKKLRRFRDPSDRVLKDLASTAQSTRGLVSLTRRFMKEYQKKKRSRRVVDFSDLEHIALDLLLGKKRTGPTAVAKELGLRYREVMVDEYQDSNEVQDAIFSAITQNRNNCFMVGDVKQSIYRFRLADPGIFLEKYSSYVNAENAVPGQGRKVLLSHNFRSAGAVIEAVNHVFAQCMSAEVGGLNYGEAEALREGIPHIEVPEPEIELHAIDVQSSTYEEEVAFTVSRIVELLDGSHMVRAGDGLRPIQPEDIVILLRAPGSVGAMYARALERAGIRCSFGGSVNVLQTEEVQMIRALLQIIDNPIQDIPLITVLSGRVFGFTADDLAQIRSNRRGSSYYSALCACETEKATAFVACLNSLRQTARIGTLPQLIREIFIRTKLDSIYAAMPDGDLRTENLQVFCQLASGYDSGGGRNLGHFLKHLEALDEKGIPGAGEQAAADAVTIMSIHKSKGLEFPVVFLSGLSRGFNKEDVYDHVLCDKDLGLGLACVDTQNRVRYPSIAKRAIAAKLLSEGLSEELRVLYVAMTRPKDRLIMTFASDNLEGVLSDIVNRMDLSHNLLLTGEVDCPGKWVLQAALRRTEAGALFAIGGYPSNLCTKGDPWLIRVVQAEDSESGSKELEELSEGTISEQTFAQLKNALGFSYAYQAATVTPSKQTATQLKGRQKDAEAAEEADEKQIHRRSWRKPSFVSKSASGKDYGNAIHSVMQYIRFEACGDLAGVKAEIERLKAERYISAEQAKIVDAEAIWTFFMSEIGCKLRTECKVLREFKFSVLDDASRYCDNIENESVLLQGVVDCAVIEDDGIVVLDFKTDRVTEETLSVVADSYRLQVLAYAQALSRIYQMPVKSTQLYFFSIGRFVTV